MTGPNKYDDNFQHRQDAIDFFRKRDRVRTVDMKEVNVWKVDAIATDKIDIH